MRLSIILRIFELKYDGFRSLAVIHNGRTQLISRNGHPFSSFENLRKALPSPYAGKTVLDGEIVCLDKRGKPHPEYDTSITLKIGVILRWKAGKNCLSGNDTTCLHPVGTAGI